MKKGLLLFVLSFFLLNSHSQIQDLSALASGKMVYRDVLYDGNAALWGYFFLYSSDNTKEGRKMEYVVLDKNLNRTCNGSYTDSPYKGLPFPYRHYNDCVLMNDRLVLDISTFVDGSLVFNSIRILPLNSDSVGEELIFNKDKFEPVPTALKLMEWRKITSDSLYNRITINPVYNQGNSGFLLYQYNPYNKIREKKVSFFNPDFEKVWTYTYNPNTSNKTKDFYTTSHMLKVRNNILYSKETDFQKNKLKAGRIKAISMKDGSALNEWTIETDTSKLLHTFNGWVYNDTVYLAGNYYDNNIYNSEPGTFRGIYRIKLGNEGKELSRTYHSWQQLSDTIIPFNNKGYFDKGKYLSRHSWLMFADGSLSLVGEEVYYQPFLLQFLKAFTFNIVNLYPSFSKNAYVVRFDQNFNFSGNTRISKDKSAIMDNHLFSQYADKHNAAVSFFNSRVKKDKNLENELIIAAISNDTVQTDRIPISSKNKYAIYPIPAKEGYVLLMEFNENDKYNQIRLEKLNF
jgi:hypothetical protein